MEISEQKVGQIFQERTKYYRQALATFFPEKRGAEQKTKSPSPKIITLPQPQLGAGPKFWATLKQRRSIRDYQKVPLTITELSNLLWATQGITDKALSPWYRTVPSAGALHPIDTYLIINRVEDLEGGIYFFQVPDFSLEVRSTGDFSQKIALAALDQEMARTAAVVFVWAAVVRRSRGKYRQRAYRYIYLDCGHIAQNLYLAAAAMGLGCCGIGAFYDDEVNALIEVDGSEETAIYLAAVGKK